MVRRYDRFQCFVPHLSPPVLVPVDRSASSFNIVDSSARHLRRGPRPRALAVLSTVPGLSGILTDPVCLDEKGGISARTCMLGLIWDSKENPRKTLSAFANCIGKHSSGWQVARVLQRFLHSSVDLG